MVTPLLSSAPQHQSCISNIASSPTVWGWRKSWEQDSQDSWSKPDQRSNITCWCEVKNTIFLWVFLFLCAYVTFCFYFIKLLYLNLHGFYFSLIFFPHLPEKRSDRGPWEGPVVQRRANHFTTVTDTWTFPVLR